MANPRPNGSVVYSFATPHERKGKTLYVNVVPRYECTNSCRFCGRKDAIAGRPNIYEQKAGTSLYLKEAPSVEEIMREVKAKMKKPFLGRFGGTKEIAFVGLGEPLLQFDLVCETLRALRGDGFEGRIRIDTNGLVKLTRPPIWFGCSELLRADPARELKEAGLTDIRISLNATDSSEYNMLCRPQLKGAFESVRDFITDCMIAGISTAISFVVGFHEGEISTRREGEYKRSVLCFRNVNFERGPPVIIRKYIPPIAEGN